MHTYILLQSLCLNCLTIHRSSLTVCFNYGYIADTKENAFAINQANQVSLKNLPRQITILEISSDLCRPNTR